MASAEEHREPMGKRLRESEDTEVVDEAELSRACLQGQSAEGGAENIDAHSAEAVAASRGMDPLWSLSGVHSAASLPSDAAASRILGAAAALAVGGARLESSSTAAAPDRWRALVHRALYRGGQLRERPVRQQWLRLGVDGYARQFADVQLVTLDAAAAYAASGDDDDDDDEAAAAAERAVWELVLQPLSRVQSPESPSGDGGGDDEVAAAAATPWPTLRAALQDEDENSAASLRGQRTRWRKTLRRRYTTVFTLLWHRVVQRVTRPHRGARHSTAVLASMLLALNDTLLPQARLSRALALTDSLVEVYESALGDPARMRSYGTLAFEALVHLMQRYRLEYPQWHRHVYGMLQVGVLGGYEATTTSVEEVRHLSRRRYALLRRLLGGTTYVPAAVAAACVKRLVQLALTATPPASVWALRLVWQLLQRHGTLREWLQQQQQQQHERRNGEGAAVSSGAKRVRRQVAGFTLWEPAPCSTAETASEAADVHTDPFRADESDPAKAEALASAPWELAAMTATHHYAYRVSEVVAAAAGDASVTGGGGGGGDDQQLHDGDDARYEAWLQRDLLRAQRRIDQYHRRCRARDGRRKVPVELALSKDGGGNAAAAGSA